MKNKILIIFIFFAMTLNVSTQTVHEPNSQIYNDIDLWFVQGYIRDFLPLVRPYPAQFIVRILEQVISNGSDYAADKAQKYLDEISPGSRFIHIGVLTEVQGNEDDNALIVAPYAEGVINIHRILSVSYNLSFYALTDHESGESFGIPGNYSPYPDLVNDTADIGPFRILQNWTSLAAVGTSDVYLQAGLSRSSFGPFYENSVVLGPQAPRAGHFSFAYQHPVWTYEILFQTLVATDDYGKGKFAEKYNVIHNLSLRPASKFEVGIVQGIVYGERIDPLYFVPFSYLFGVQAINGFSDNAFIGLNFRIRPADTFLFRGQAYIDDFSFNGILSADPHFKAATEIGMSWTPLDSFLSKLDFDYTAVLPYMYTHWHNPSYNRYNGPDPNNPSRPLGDREPRIGNYLNYTHMGRNLGADLEPNSDRVSLRTRWKVLPNLDLNILGYIIRHGNASEERELFDPNYHDGSVFDSGSTDPWMPNHPGEETIHNYYEEINFLTQNILYTRLGGSIGFSWTVPVSLFEMRLFCDYGIQKSWNKDFIKDNNSLDHFWSVGASIIW